ncbi:MAG: DUF3108 domain-containing protein [Candidatus Eiseniibacteriota bacterium]|nr:MAG: DUF3108 domain-containing protein [Candidatus Eisenbacteria bacterium]
MTMSEARKMRRPCLFLLGIRVMAAILIAFGLNAQGPSQVSSASVAPGDSLSSPSGSPGPDEARSVPLDACTPSPANAPFNAGEWFHFSVQYGIVKAGDALMQVEGMKDIDGHPCYHLVSKAESSNLFSLFFKVRDRVDSFMDRERLVTRRFSKRIREGKHRSDADVEFDHEAGLARYSDGTEMEFLSCTQDILSAFYYVRTLKLNVGERVSLPCHADKKNYPLEVIVHGKETVKTPAGRFDCLVIEPVLKSEGVFRQKGRLTIWLTDDARRIPVLMKSKVTVGSISAILTDMNFVGPGG